MPFSTEESSLPTNSNQDEINDFFNDIVESPKSVRKAPPSSAPVVQPIVQPIVSSLGSKCASWLQSSSFQIRPTEEADTDPTLIGSPLPESVYSCQGLTRKLEKNRRRSAESELKIKEKRARIEEREPSTFFEKLAKAEKEIEEKSENWVKVNGFWVENQDVEEVEGTMDLNRTISKYEEIMSLFENNPRLYDVVSFEHSYKFDLDHYSKDSMQYVVFTKVCQSHGPDDLIEMKKEDLRCSDCGGSNLAVTVRLTIPLDLAEVPIPCFDDIQVHVAFQAKQLLEKSGLDSLEISEKSVDFSKEKCREMYNLYTRMVRHGRHSEVYKAWFERCKQFVKKYLHSKRVTLCFGRVIRKKVEESRVDGKKRCFLFSTMFDLD